MSEMLCRILVQSGDIYCNETIIAAGLKKHKLGNALLHG